MSVEIPTCPQCGAPKAADAGPGSCRCVRGVASRTPRPGHRTPAWVTLTVLGLTLTALAGAAVSIRSYWRTEVQTAPAIMPQGNPAEQFAKDMGSPAGAPPVAQPPSAGGATVMRPVQAMVARFHVYRAEPGGRALIIALPAQWTDAPPGIILGPHFGTLARLLMEQAVLNAARDELAMVTRVATLGDALPEAGPDFFVEVVVPVLDELKQLAPVLAGHPYRRFVESYGYGPQQPPQLLLKLLRELNPADFEMSALPFFVTFQNIDPGAMSYACIQAQWHADEVYRELVVAGRTLQNAAPAQMPKAQRLRAVSPHSSEAVALLIFDHWDQAQAHAKEWEKQYAEHPNVIARLAARYRELGAVEDEQRCLEQYNRLVPARRAWSLSHNLNKWGVFGVVMV